VLGQMNRFEHAADDNGGNDRQRAKTRGWSEWSDEWRRGAGDLPLLQKAPFGRIASES
jgi:hypothetical protein